LGQADGIFFCGDEAGVVAFGVGAQAVHQGGRKGLVISQSFRVNDLGAEVF
jgi:hypothetical protein